MSVGVREALGLALGVAIVPHRAFGRLRELRPSRAAALGPTVVVALLWAAFLALLSAMGHEPSGPLLLPVARSGYYAAEALFVVPLRVVMVVAAAAALHALAHRGRGGAPAACSLAATSLAFAVPDLLAWLLPDLLVLLLSGFEALGPAMRIYVPLCLAWTLALLVLAARHVHGASWGRSVACALLAALVHGALGAPFLR